MTNTVNVIKASSASDFEHHNVVQLCGRIVGKKRFKRDELKFTISCGRGNRVRKDKDGKFTLRHNWDWNIFEPLK